MKTKTVDVIPNWDQELFNELVVIHELDECSLHKNIAKDGDLAEGACGTIFIYRKDKSPSSKYCRDCVQVPANHIRCWYCRKSAL